MGLPGSLLHLPQICGLPQPCTAPVIPRGHQKWWCLNFAMRLPGAMVSFSFFPLSSGNGFSGHRSTKEGERQRTLTVLSMGQFVIKSSHHPREAISPWHHTGRTAGPAFGARQGALPGKVGAQEHYPHRGSWAPQGAVSPVSQSEEPGGSSSSKCCRGAIPGSWDVEGRAIQAGVLPHTPKPSESKDCAQMETVS